MRQSVQLIIVVSLFACSGRQADDTSRPVTRSRAEGANLAAHGAPGGGPEAGSANQQIASVTFPPVARLPPPPAPAALLLPVRTTGFAPIAAGRDLRVALATPFQDRWDVHVGKARRPRTLLTCNDYLALGTDDVQADRPDQGVLDGVIADCEALKMMLLARPSKLTFLDGFHLDAKALVLLPAAFYLDLSPDEEADLKAAAIAGRTWKDFDPTVHVAKTTDERVQLLVKGTGYDANLSEYARGDFDHDGVEDILIRRFAYPHGGSMTDYTVFLLTRDSQTAPLRTLKSWRQSP